uniref:Uncharacterized protein n=1 Tax=Acrobeloides nanus TaxID=290746 RepID=A0A914CWT9_9BILA
MIFSLPFYYGSPEDPAISEYLKDYHKLQSLASATGDASKINRLKFHMRGHAGDVAEAIDKTGFVDSLSVWPHFFSCFANEAKNEDKLTFPACRSVCLWYLLGEISYSRVLLLKM